MSVAYAWSKYRSTCALCLKEIKRGDGVGIQVEDAESFRTDGSKARWAHARCATDWQQRELQQAAAKARAGYALRKGMAANEGNGKKLSQAAVKYGARRLKRSSRQSVDQDLGVQCFQPVLPAFEPGSPYALNEARIAEVMQEMCSHGVRIDLDKIAELRGLAEPSETVRSVSRALIGDRVHPTFHVSAATGRISLRQPNLGSLQRSPESQERALVIPEPGHVMFTVDMAQVEARVVAALSQDPDYLTMFGDGRDVHAEVAEQLLGDRARRQEAKTLVHGLNYGMGKSKLAETARVSVGDAEAFIRSLAQRFPLLASWIEETIAEARIHGQLMTRFGRVVSVERSKAHTRSVARLVQATARDLFFQGVLTMHAVGLTDYLRLVLHDEVVMSVPADAYSQIAHDTQMCLTRSWRPYAAAQRVNLPVNVSQPGASWLDANTNELAAVV